MIDEKLLEILVCPLTKGELEYHKSTGELWSREAKLAYPTKDGIPVMIVDKARTLTAEELKTKS